MTTFLAVRVDPEAMSWRDLPQGYLIIGELTTSGDMALDQALIAEPGISYVDETTGAIHRFGSGANGVKPSSGAASQP